MSRLLGDSRPGRGRTQVVFSPFFGVLTQYSTKQPENDSVHSGLLLSEGKAWLQGQGKAGHTARMVMKQRRESWCSHHVLSIQLWPLVHEMELAHHQGGFSHIT